MVVDASATNVGECLRQQLPDRKDWQPLGFFSKKLETAQQKYSAFHRELFPCYSGIRHFWYMLDGRRFAIFSDHKPLTYALARVLDPWTAHQSRQLSYMAEYGAWWQTLSPDRTAMRRHRGLPLQRPVLKRPPGLRF